MQRGNEVYSFCIKSIANWAVLTTVQPVQEDDLRSLWEIKKKKKKKLRRVHTPPLIQLPPLLLFIF